METPERNSPTFEKSFWVLLKTFLFFFRPLSLAKKSLTYVSLPLSKSPQKSSNYLHSFIVSKIRGERSERTQVSARRSIV